MLSVIVDGAPRELFGFPVSVGNRSIAQFQNKSAITDVCAEATNVGATDIQVLADFTGANGDGTTGAATVTVLYMQNNSVQDAVDL